MLPHLDILIRIIIGSVLGGVIGFERDRHGRPIGLRTHLIVAMASATFMIISTQFIYYQGYGENKPEADIARIAASVVSAVGFLAGGAILKSGFSIQGLTTAAGLWLVTAIGMAAGAGMFPEAVTVTLLGIFALTTLRKFEDKNDQLLKRHVSLTMSDKTADVQKIMGALKEIGGDVTEWDYQKNIDANNISLAFDIKFPSEIGVTGLISKLENLESVSQIHVKTNGH